MHIHIALYKIERYIYYPHHQDKYACISDNNNVLAYCRPDLDVKDVKHLLLVTITNTTITDHHHLTIEINNAGTEHIIQYTGPLKHGAEGAAQYFRIYQISQELKIQWPCQRAGMPNQMIQFGRYQISLSKNIFRHLEMR